MPVYDGSSGPSGFFNGGGLPNNQYPNPYYNVAQQYLPISVESQLWWMDYLLLRNGFLKSALARVVNYFINTLIIEDASEDVKKKYEEIFRTLKYKVLLNTSGLNLTAMSNEVVSVTQGFDRFLKCLDCNNTINIEKTNNYEFNKGKYTHTCPSCKSRKSEIIDIPSKDIKKLSIIHWPIRQLITRHDKISGQTDYYWQIPQEYVRNVSKKNNKFFSKVTPKYVMDCIFTSGGPKLLKLNKANLLHLKLPHPSSIETDGKAIPLGMFMFDDFFSYQTVKRFNEVIMYEHIVPFNLFSMASDNSPASSPVFNQNGGVWKSAIEEMVLAHKRDPGSYQTFPFPVNFQQLGGQGKELAPVELMQQYKSDILGNYNIPQELYNMNFATANAPAPMLRLFENAWSIIPDSLNEVLQHIADIVSKIYGYEKIKVSMLASTISDDIEKKSIINSLVQANVLAKSTLTEIYGINYMDQVRKKIKEDDETSRIQREEQEKSEIEQSTEANVLNQPSAQTAPGQPAASYNTAGSNPNDVLQQAQEIAQKLLPLEAGQIRTELQTIKSTNPTLYAAVKTALGELRASGKSQGNQQIKQEAAQANQ